MRNNLSSLSLGAAVAVFATVAVLFSLQSAGAQEAASCAGSCKSVPVWNPVCTGSEIRHGHMLAHYKHDTDPEWGYKDARSDVFAIYFPTKGSGPHPLCVMFHSAGGGIDESLCSAFKPDGCDVYHMPDDFYSLHLDCLAHKSDDWWWGGINQLAKEGTEDYDNNQRRLGPNLTPCEKRVMAVVRWVIARYDIDPNRVYLCGNSMGGSGTLGIGLRHGDVFAAIKANVPAGTLHAANRIGLLDPLPEGVRIPDPPICVDYSAQNDQWSVRHDILYNGMEDKKYAILGYWGCFGHANKHADICQVNDLIDTFDWISVRKNEAYPVFTNASTDDPLPWPDNVESEKPGQVNAYFRWTVHNDSADIFEIALRLTSAEELKSKIFAAPAESTADVSFRRLQQFKVAPGEKVNWSFAGKSGTVTADGNGLVTVPCLTVKTVPAVLTLTK